jgi:hypothetical protein
MRKPSFLHLLVLSLCATTCTTAAFDRIELPDGASPDTPVAEDAPAGGVPDVVSAEALACRAPSVERCQPQIQAPCDPVCQTGSCDWCAQKCGQTGDGTAACTKAGALPTGSLCTISLDGTPDRYDNCAAGNICLTPDPGSGLSYCFALCRSTADCLYGVACSNRPLSASGGSAGMAKVCDPPYRSCVPGALQPCCDPLGATSGCDFGQFCYLVSPDASHDNRTVCDYTTGSGGRSSQCSSSRECMLGWTCFGANTGVAGICRKVCDPKAANPCGVGQGQCGDYGNQYGVCPA